MLLVNCKLTWKKVLYFMVYGGLIATLLHIFGFGKGFFYTLLFCSCAATPGFFCLTPQIIYPNRLQLQRCCSE